MTEDERVQLEVERFNEQALLRHQQCYRAGTALPSLAFCASCGNEIPERRRAALPSVRVCIECKRAEELDNKRLVG